MLLQLTLPLEEERERADDKGACRGFGVWGRGSLLVKAVKELKKIVQKKVIFIGMVL